ncbi:MULTISPECIES: FUSC family protein [Polaromonas]|uniref:FUSC family membrane protein n=1 Tax=Polaromonas aquatica TaxID=332657 RepID=A0ABW1U5C1_9BURK
MNTSQKPATPMHKRLHDRVQGWLQQGLRVVLSQYVANGLTVALGLVLVMLAIFEASGLAAAATASVGVMITSLPDVPSPRKRKIMQMLPAPLLGAPLFALVQLVRQDEVLLGVVLVAGTFLAMMMMAWGKRGGPICFSLLFSLLFSMAAPPAGSLEHIAQHTGWFLAGSVLYLLWAVLTTHWLNQRFRTQLLAECLSSFAQILRTQAQRFAEQPDHQALLASMLQQQAALADQLQNTRDVVLESPTTPARQRLAAMLLSLLEARDHQLACDLDLDFLLEQGVGTTTLPALQHTLEATADRLEALGMSLLLGRTGHAIEPIADLRLPLAGLLPPHSTPANQLAPEALKLETPDSVALLHNMADRIGHISDEAVKMAALARGDLAPELAAVRTQWQLFVSATTWSWKPLLGVLAWRAPMLRYALRATLAVAAGYVISLHLPWVAHDYWILLTIVVVMRGNLAQTVQRRNARVAGTLLGCGFVMAMLATHPGARTIFLVVALSMGLAHAFALRRYLYTSIAATVSGLLQAHLLLVGVQPTFAVGERLADTLLGALIAWLFSYVLPAWERNQLPGLVRRSVQAQVKHARLALALLGGPQTSDLAWRLARRDAYNSLSDLTLATQRTLAEPRQVRPPLEPLEALQARSYQLLAQLTAVKSLLLLHKPQLDLAVATPALALAAERIAAELSDTAAPPQTTTHPVAGQPYQPRPDPLMAADLTPWLLRRLDLACAMARELRLAMGRALA